MSDAERMALYTLMGQWGRKPDLLYQKVREWIEARDVELIKAAIARARLEESEAIKANWNVDASFRSFGTWIDARIAANRKVAATEKEEK